MNRRGAVQFVLVTCLAICSMSIVAHGEDAPPMLISEFSETCIEYGTDAEALSNSFEEGSWDNKTEKPTPRLAKLLKLGDEGLKSMPQGSGAYEVLVFEKIAGPKLFEGIISLIHIGKQKFVGCQLYDTSAQAVDFPTTFPEKLNGVEPVMQAGEGFKALTWKHPTSLPAFITVRINYFAPDSQPAKMSGFSGIMMSTTAKLQDQ